MKVFDNSARPLRRVSSRIRSFDLSLSSTVRRTLRSCCWRIVLAVAVLLSLMSSYSHRGLSDSNAHDESRAARADVSDWRRTAAGWERAGDWQPNSPTRLAVPKFKSADAVHPLVVAALELLVSLGALLFFSLAGPLRGKKVGVKSSAAKIA